MTPELELGVPGVQPEVVIRLSWVDFQLLLGSPFLPAADVSGGFGMARDDRAGERRAALLERLSDLAGAVLAERVKGPAMKPGFESFDLVWATPGSSGEDGDVVATVAEIREKLATHPEAKVRLRVGTREFGEKVLRALEGSDDELGRVTVLLGGEHG